MGIYGHKFDAFIENRTQEALLEQYLTEIHISKKDLQDPDVLNKVLEKTKKSVNNHNNAVLSLGMLLGLACDIITGVVTGSILAPIVLFIPFIIGSILLFMKFTKDAYVEEVKSIKKLETKLNDMKKKAQKLKDEKEKKKIIETCDKALASIADREKNRYRNGTIDFLENILYFLKNPYTLGDGSDSDIITALHGFGMSKEGLAKFVFANKTKFKDFSNYMGGNDPEEEYDHIASKSEIEKMKDAVVILNNDDYIFFLSLVDKKLYEVTADNFYIFNFEGYSELYDLEWSDFELNDPEIKKLKDQIDKIVAKYK